MFRQRAGHVNWKRLTSVDVDVLLKDSNDDGIAELNTCIDNLTFATFSTKDVENNSCEAIVKLVRLMQLIIEYLLYSQENQAKILVETTTKSKSMKKKNLCLLRESEALKEDLKIYKKQLLILKSSKGHLNDKNYKYVLGDSPDRSKKDSSLIKSFLNHEDSTRLFMKDMLEEQRAAFLREISEITKLSEKNEAFTTQKLLKSIEDREDALESRENRLKQELQSLLDQQTGIKEKEMRLQLRESELTLTREREQRALHEKEHDLDIIHKKAKEVEERLEARQQQLTAFESHVQRKESAADSRRSMGTSWDRGGLMDSTSRFVEKIHFSQLILKTKLFSAGVIFRAVQRKLTGQMKKAVDHWKSLIYSSKLAGAQKAQQDMVDELLHFKTKEAELTLQLRGEQQRLIIEQAKLNTFVRQADSISTSKAAALSQLSDASMMTSIDFGALSVVPLRPAVPDYIARAKSGEELMARVEVDIRQSLITAEEKAAIKRRLAEEIMLRLDSSSHR